MATKVVTGRRVYTRHGDPPVEALAIRDGAVIGTGQRSDMMRRATAEGLGPPELIDFEDGIVMPAFVDPHVHAFLVAADPATDRLHRRAATIPELLGVIAEEVKAIPPGAGWVRLHGYEPLLLAERRSPTAAELDAISGDRPLHVLTRTFHESVVNTAGLRALGITDTTPDPPGGRILRSRRGAATGVLLESASFEAESASRTPDVDWRPHLEAFGRQLLSYGIVRIGDAAVPANVADDLVTCLSALGVSAHPLLVGSRIDQPALVPGGTAKVLVDGGEFCDLCMTPRQVRALWRASIRANLGSERQLARAVGLRTGWPRKEADGTWHTGINVTQDIATLLRSAADVGSGLAMHSVGNGALDRVLSARAADPGASSRVPLRIEHAMTLDESQARALADARLPVVAQPGFLVTLGHEFAVVPLPDPLRFMPLKMMWRAGIDLSFSSDYPATPLNPWIGIAGAVTRRDRTGAVILADEAMDRAAALRSYTEAGAYVLGDEAGGRLDVGGTADFVVVDADPYDVPDDRLAGIGTRSTWRAATCVWSTA